MAPAKALVLFDIDGTLLRRAGSHHKEALLVAVKEVTGHDTSFDRIPTGGMLDRDLIRALLRETPARVRDIQRWMPAIVGRAQEHYESICPELSDKVCPGARELLQTLTEAGIPAGLVTGNLSAIAWKKMEACGLRPFFEVGAFADMASTRAGLARIAMRAAKRKGIADGGTVVSLIGDHPNDVQAAKLNGIRSIAVATGLSSFDELAACQPDALVPDLRSLRLESLL
jgi:phosphoglycolate phosphatase-like HAD superfamily hydrolase